MEYLKKQGTKRIVAIYARVSTEHEAQLSALENQMQYYDNILSQHPEWELYDRYIDEGITGTSTKKRKDFMRMMEDAHEGRFDLIITREVSRFARNTVDTLQETRRLKRIGVEVWFTEDNIWTLNDEDGELRLTIMATLAQNESKKTSMRVKAGQMVSFQNGVPYGNGNILGYDKEPNHGKYIINEEQARTVRMIYDMYLDGMGLRAIQFELEKRGRLTATGLTKWSCTAISRTLKNSFYCGIVQYRKQYVPDYLEQKKINNNGAVDYVIVKGEHEPIVTEEEYNEVMKRINSRTTKSANNKTIGRRCSEDVWCRKMICCCGHKFNRVKWHNSTKDGELPQYAYQCYHSLRTGTVSSRLKKGLSIEGVCDVPMFPRWKLAVQAKMLFELLFQDKQRIIRIANDLIDHCINSEMEDSERKDEILQKQNQISRVKNKLNNLLDMRLADEISKDIYNKKKDELENELALYEKQIEELTNFSPLSQEEIDNRIELLKYAASHQLDFDKYNIPDEIIDAFVEKIVVYKDYFEWYLKFDDDDCIRCLVNGTKRKNDVQIVGDPPLALLQHRLQLLQNRHNFIRIILGVTRTGHSEHGVQ